MNRKRVGLEHATRYMESTDDRFYLAVVDQTGGTRGRWLACLSQLYWPTLVESTVGCPRLTQLVLVWGACSTADPTHGLVHMRRRGGPPPAAAYVSDAVDAIVIKG
jgi:hypothetical protein